MAAKSPVQTSKLRAHICSLIDEGRLPVLLPEKISAGYGSGSKCHGCNQPVTATQIEYDIEECKNATVQLSLHLGCYLLWQIECVKRMS